MTAVHFDRILEKPVAIPVDQWTLELTVEEDRPLSPLEEAILRLADAGVRRLERFAELLGIDQRLVASGIGQLRLKNALLADQSAYSVSETGKRFLQANLQRTLRRVTARVHHDPYGEKFSWPSEDNEGDEAAGLWKLPAPPEWRKESVADSQAELQQLLNHGGLPEDQVTEYNPQVAERTLVVNVAPGSIRRIYLPGTLIVSLNKLTCEAKFELFKEDNLLDQSATAIIQDLWKNGTEVLPLISIGQHAPAIQRILDRMISLHTGAEAIKQEDASKGVTLAYKAVEQARNEVLMFESFSEGLELLTLLQRHLTQRPDLRAVVLLTSSPTGEAPSHQTTQRLQQMATIENLKGRFYWAPLDDLHAHAVFKDGDWAVVSTPEMVRNPSRVNVGFPYVRRSFNAKPDTVNSIRQDLMAVIRNLPAQRG
ncbi:hypothetical protein Dgeo_2930 (plasmid) [Deinococcus geothermalis DSM 11300]|uniref:Uncharacterized protein n=1 Tax=Deinococcus geothermalis (strain DSM 11300 / CIP 105573 / AG-3a) TaxID=319795 RepID=A8ZR64_DEIGD|nr:hypothetical protein [Deinococcus geothermalis]ABW34973.1 hypothetical protein Dgeo_2930 [Deinococcus geothermalis DSM 11300]